MKAYVFPGQGSQSVGMGEGLFEKYSDLTKKADEILGYSIQSLCLSDPNEVLNLTQYTQPALYVVNAFMYYEYVKEHGEPDYLAGHSLGEYNALLAGGAFDLETGLKLVKLRAELMGKVKDGGMAAILHLEEEKIRQVIKEKRLDSIDIANLNSPSQIVISGPVDALKDAEQYFIEAGALKYVMLKVSGAFHSRYMKVAGDELGTFFDTLSVGRLRIPVIANVNARPYRQSDIKRNLIEQLSSSVRWTETIRYLMGKEVEDIIQIGPGNVLTGLTRQIKRLAKPLIVEDEPIETEPVEQKPALEEYIPQKHEKFVMGSESFCKRYQLKYPYAVGGMYRKIASVSMVVRSAKAGLLSFFGSGGVSVEELEEAVVQIKRELCQGEMYGVDMLANINAPEKEMKRAKVLIKHNVPCVEASAYINVTPALIWYKASGLKRVNGKIESTHKVFAKISREDVASAFMEAPSRLIVDKLTKEGYLTEEQAELALQTTVADDICVESDSAGHTDHGLNFAVLPAIRRKREILHASKMHIGLAGGIGSPEAIAAAFMLGADFVLTGSINQCTVEAGISDSVKDILETVKVQDTDYAPAGDMFELGGQVQVLKKGLFFPARARRLYELYRLHNSLDEIDKKTLDQLEKYYFKKTIAEVYDEVKAYCSEKDVERMEQNPKYKMSSVFRWYFGYATRVAINGEENAKVDYQIHCSPAMGCFNQLVAGTDLESWHNRHVDEIGIMLMEQAADYMKKYFQAH